MKIYHTETQEDYDALMVELEEQGRKWASGRKPTESKDWVDHEEKTGVVIEKRITRAYIGKLKFDYPDIPIIKYKAKTEEKMRFTKENVYRLFGDYRRNKNGIHRLDNLESVIMELDDTPEKVVVPKFVADWIEQHKESGTDLQAMLKWYRHFCDNINFRPEAYSKKAVQWYVDNPYKFIQAYEKGYTIEPEQFYYIPLPELQTTDGIQQVLSKRENSANYFASRPNENLKQRFTKEEIAQVPVSYKPYAKPIEEEEE